MKKFVFSLEALLEVRIRKEEDIEKKLAQKNGEIELVRKEIERIQQDLKNFQISEKSRRAHGEDIFSMRYSVSWRNQLKLDMLTMGKKYDDLCAQAYSIRQELTKATQEKKAVEIIKEKRYREWKLKHKREEQKALDDISTQGFIRKRSIGETP
ncbi:hypothetical protein CHISP_1869 [Chitinispirillum alkaliphilum]|nr:hypothetical protein CHISP_1869 [Chitinispirillum alkaliphilum]